MKSKKNTSNLVFSACLVTAFVICAYFFEGMITTSTGMSDTIKSLLEALLFVIFGLFLFYATRVGDGKQVRRFSLSTLIIMDLPALYIILASFATGLPFSEQIASSNVMVYAAAVVLGYGIPYTFLSGYEIQPEEEEETDTDDDSEESDEDAEEDFGDEIEKEIEKESDTDSEALQKNSETDSEEENESYDDLNEEK